MSNGVPRLHVEITAELHRRAKIAAAVKQQTMRALIETAVEQYVERVEHEERHGR